MRTRQKQRIIIGTLCAVIVGLAIGYAVLSQTLNINGTGSIASDFNILFTDIQEGTMNGATTINKQITDSTTATFTIDLKKPGDSGEYLITVENRGTIDAMVESISGIDEANQAAPTDITFSISDIAVNDKLPAKESKVFKVKVDWSSASTSIPSTNKNLTLSINFVQDASSTPTPETAAEYLINNKLSSDINTSPTNGLFAIDNTGELTTSTSPREYRYIGANPDNYIQFNNELWRIIGIFDGQLKIIRNESLGEMVWQEDNSDETNWYLSSLKTYLNNDYYNTINENDKLRIDNYTWALGDGGTYSTETAQSYYENERNSPAAKWTGKIALIYPSDSGFATSGGSTTNRSSCLAEELYYWYVGKDSFADCYNNNWLYGIASPTGYWAVTTSIDSIPVTRAPAPTAHPQVFYISERYPFLDNRENYHDVLPTLYLKSDVEFSGGTGTNTDPYILK